MSKLRFMIKYGTLDDAKKAVAASNKEVLGYATGMVKLLDRMKAEGDPDYEKMRNEHIGEMANDRIKASWVVDSDHASPEHLKTIADKFPHMLERVAKNKNADGDTLHQVFWKGYDHTDGSIATDTMYNVAKHPNAPKDLLEIIAKHGGFRTSAMAKSRLATDQYKEYSCH